MSSSVADRTWSRMRSALASIKLNWRARHRGVGIEHWVRRQEIRDAVGIVRVCRIALADAGALT